MSLVSANRKRLVAAGGTARRELAALREAHVVRVNCVSRAGCVTRGRSLLVPMLALGSALLVVEPAVARRGGRAREADVARATGMACVTRGRPFAATSMRGLMPLARQRWAAPCRWCPRAGRVRAPRVRAPRAGTGRNQARGPSTYEMEGPLPARALPGPHRTRAPAEVTGGPAVPAVPVLGVPASVVSEVLLPAPSPAQDVRPVNTRFFGLSTTAAALIHREQRRNRNSPQRCPQPLFTTWRGRPARRRWRPGDGRRG